MHWRWIGRREWLMRAALSLIKLSERASRVVRRRLPPRVRRLLGLILFVLCTVWCCGCSKDGYASSSCHAGVEGRIMVCYASGYEARNFNKPVQRGGELTLGVEAIARGEERRVEVLEARSLDPSRVSIVGHGRRHVTIKGLRRGAAWIELDVVDQRGDHRRDRVMLRVDRPVEVIFFPEWSSEWGASKVKKMEARVGSYVEVPWARFSDKEEVLIGHGAPPVEIKPPWTGRVDALHRRGDSIKLIMPDFPCFFEVIPAQGVRGERLMIEVKR